MYIFYTFFLNIDKFFYYNELIKVRQEEIKKIQNDCDFQNTKSKISDMFSPFVKRAKTASKNIKENRNSNAFDFSKKEGRSGKRYGLSVIDLQGNSLAKNLHQEENIELKKGVQFDIISSKTNMNIENKNMKLKENEGKT